MCYPIHDPQQGTYKAKEWRILPLIAHPPGSIEGENGGNDFDKIFYMHMASDRKILVYLGEDIHSSIE